MPAAGCLPNAWPTSRYSPHHHEHAPSTPAPSATQQPGTPSPHNTPPPRTLAPITTTTTLHRAPCSSRPGLHQDHPAPRTPPPHRPMHRGRERLTPLLLPPPTPTHSAAPLSCCLPPVTSEPCYRGPSSTSLPHPPSAHHPPVHLISPQPIISSSPTSSPLSPPHRITLSPSSPTSSPLSPPHRTPPHVLLNPKTLSPSHRTPPHVLTGPLF